MHLTSICIRRNIQEYIKEKFFKKTNSTSWAACARCACSFFATERVYQARQQKPRNRRSIGVRRSELAVVGEDWEGSIFLPPLQERWGGDPYCIPNSMKQIKSTRKRI
jgi:hypothetical protein